MKRVELSQLSVEVYPEFQDNYLFILTSKNSLAVVDPGDAELAIKALAGRKLDAIWVTHHHADHIGGLQTLKAATGAKVYAAKSDLHRIPGVDHALSEGDEWMFGDCQIHVWETPGHTSGHITYVIDGAIFCGDVLFSIGCGKLFEGTPQVMWPSLERIRGLPDHTKIFCSHEYTMENASYALTIDGENEALQKYVNEARALRGRGEYTIPSTVGVEKMVNPFLRPDYAAIRSSLQLGSHDLATSFGRIRADKDHFDSSR